jgi:hypothetical protein
MSPIAPCMSVDEILQAGRDVDQLQIAAAMDLAGDVFGNVFRPALQGC